MQEATAAKRPYSFDGANFEVELNVSTDASKEKLVGFKLNKPQTDWLIQRERETSSEIVETSPTEDEIKIQDEKANARLFDRIIAEVRGYRLAGEPKELSSEYREPSEALKAAIYASHKAAAVRAMYPITARVKDDDEGVVLGGDALTIVELLFGDADDPTYVIEFDMREPDEDARLKFQDRASRLLQVKGARKSRSRLIGNLKASIEFFDEYVEDIRGGVVRGSEFNPSQGDATTPTREQFLAEVDAIFKRAVVGAFMAKYNAKVQD